MGFSTYDPFRQETLHRFEYDSESVIQEKLRQLHESQKYWSAFSVEKRAQRVLGLADRVLKNKETMAVQATREMGKPIAQARAEVEKCALALKVMAQMAPEYLKPRQVETQYKSTVVFPDAYGVVFSIQPWNFPYWQALRMSACAWMAGNVVLLKHATLVAGCGDLIESVVDDGEPPLLLNSYMTHEQAALVMSSKFVNAVTFTGSTEGGRNVAKAAGYGLKKCILELGGNDAYIVLADCNLETAVEVCVRARLINSGQSCIAGKRFYVEDKIYPQFRDRFIAEMKKQKSGNPMDLHIQVGPLASPHFVEGIEKQILNAKALGAQFHEVFSRQGGFSSRGVLDFGDNLRAFEDEEVFGPVALLYRFHHLDQVVSILNEGPFGLGGGVFTQDLDRARQLAQQVKVGTFAINTFVQSDPHAPFGGTRNSGFGRELGVEGLQDFINWKVVGQN